MNSIVYKLIYRWQLLIKKNYLKHHLNKLEVKDFTIVSSNCWGGIVYQDLGMSYQTPFVNMFVHAPCFIRLVKNFAAYMTTELTLSNHSKYFSRAAAYPIGHLNDVEIHFIHYSWNDDVIGKWNQRKQRMNYNKLLFVLSERDNCSARELNEMNMLPVRKIMFTSKNYGFSSAYRIFSINKDVLPADMMMGFSYKKLNLIDFLNRTFGSAK